MRACLRTKWQQEQFTRPVVAQQKYLTYPRNLVSYNNSFEPSYLNLLFLKATAASFTRLCRPPHS
jgi:hypothetical protein